MCPRLVPSDSELAQVLRGLDSRVTESLKAQNCDEFFDANKRGFGPYLSALRGIRESIPVFRGRAKDVSKERGLAFCSMEFLASLTQQRTLKMPLKSGITDFGFGKRTAAFKRGGLFERMFEGYREGLSYLWQHVADAVVTCNPCTDILACKDWGDFGALYDKVVRNRISEAEGCLGLATTDVIVEMPTPNASILAPILEPYRVPTRDSTESQLDAEFLWYNIQVLDGGDSVLYPGTRHLPSFSRDWQGCMRTAERKVPFKFDE